MKLAKPQHEAFALFFETPTREKLREINGVRAFDFYKLSFALFITFVNESKKINRVRVFDF